MSTRTRTHATRTECKTASSMKQQTDVTHVTTGFRELLTKTGITTNVTVNLSSDAVAVARESTQGLGEPRPCTCVHVSFVFLPVYL